MGWLDKGFKNIVKGGKDLLSGPAGIMLLSAAAPWLSAGLGGTGMMAGLKGAMNPTLLKTLSSPWVKNALTNAAMQGGIATLTGSKHPWKAMGYAALGSMPFTALQSAQAASAFNKTNSLLGTEDAAKWYDFALGNDKIIPGGMDYKDIVGETLVDDIGFKPTNAELASGNYEVPQMKLGYSKGPAGGPLTTQLPDTTYKNLGDSMSYFTNPGASKAALTNPGLSGAMSALTGDLDLMATAVPQIAGMYGGRMTEEEQWLASKEKQIRLWGFQHGIPYEEAREIWKDGYRNPYYQTRTPHDYGDFKWSGSDAYAGKNKGGSIQYKDDYTAGGSAVGPGTGTSDDIQPVALSNGEFVFTEEATNNFPGGPEGLYSLMNSLDPNSERPEEARV